MFALRLSLEIGNRQLKRHYEPLKYLLVKTALVWGPGDTAAVNQ